MLRRTKGITGLAVLALAAAACGGGSTSGRAGKGDTLTLVSLSPPASLDPAKANVDPFSSWTVNLPYDSLMRFGRDGRIEPGLAVAWKYVGTGNKVFRMTLREGVRFADGTPVTAGAVAASIDYFRENGLNRSWLSAIKRVRATDVRTVLVECGSANPALPRLFTQISQIGSVISPAGLRNPGRLGTRSFGAGPYVLDPARTVTGDHYTFTPNPGYWDKSKIHWSTVVVKIIANQSSALQAVRTGQGDIVGIDPNSVDAAKSAGLTVVWSPGGMIGMNLIDRDGKVAKPLADLRVRKALNHAVDRAAIMKAVYRDYGKPSAQLTIPGSDSFDPSLDNAYPYDPGKARRLLAEAGYPHGFRLTVQTANFFGINLVTQAVLDQWQKVGVTAEVTTETTVGGWLQSIMTRKFAATGFGYGALPLYLQSLDWFLPNPTPFNPFATQDPALTAGLAKANAAAPEAQERLYQAVMRTAVDKAWFVAVGRTDGNYAVSPRITGLEPDQRTFGDVAWYVRAK